MEYVLVVSGAIAVNQ